ncbi:arylsulfatase [Haloferula chungangensis]|uniref:Arylsulfatase n=1 Tax=Haloferula chungangensis TaxID=1048331 RepID=A0ABW2L5D5_9BACT
MKLSAPFIAAILTSAVIAAAEPKPDILVILADDMGFSDPACFGGELATPSLDRLAAQGTRLTHFYNGGMCVVSRASLLTGQWWPRGLENFKKSKLLPERLKGAGYRNALIGKWHLAGNPMDRGFDHFFGFLGGFADHYKGSADYRLDRQPFKDFGEDYYSSDAFADRAINFIRSSKRANPEQPLFIYLSFQAPHNPLQAPEADIRRHRGKYLKGWQVTREARFKRQQEMGIISSERRLPSYPENLPAWESLTPAQRDLEDLRMATYAAMVERMDHGIGRVIKTLESHGRADNTLIVFLSDNGADSFSVVDQAMLQRKLLPGDPGSNFQPGTGWAYASVTPWRLYKISQHAGGITTGAIIRWPGKATAKSQILANSVHIADLAPTLLDLINVESDGFDGESFLPLRTDSNWNREGPMFFQYMDNRAIRTGDWTLVEADGSGWELYDARKDPMETENLVAQKPELTQQLAAQWNDWWRSQNQGKTYKPTTTKDSPHYKPQGDRGTGTLYKPSAMPAGLSERLPIE